MKRLAYILLGVCVCTSCQLIHRERKDDVVVQLLNATLTQQQLDEVTRQATSPEDSTAQAEAYIRQWAVDVLLADKAGQAKDPEIEQMVADYRRELYLHAYEQRYVAKKLNSNIELDTIEAYYEANKQQFVLTTHLLKGVLLIVPNGAPDLVKLRKWLRSPMENIEKIEKYAYQYATGYELFTEDWHTGQQILRQMPLETQKLTDMLHKETQIEAKDSVQTYLLQICDKRLKGETMPLEFAQKEIEKILLRERQVALLKAHREALLHEAEEKMTRQERQ